MEQSNIPHCVGPMFSGPEANPLTTTPADLSRYTAPNALSSRSPSPQRSTTPDSEQESSDYTQQAADGEARSSGDAEAIGSLPDMAKPVYRKHKRLRCYLPGCGYAGTFKRRWELERHVKGQHLHEPAVGNKDFYQCSVQTCRSSSKLWSRLDRFRSHAMRCHPSFDLAGLLTASRCGTKVHQRSHNSSAELQDAMVGNMPRAGHMQCLSQAALEWNEKLEGLQGNTQSVSAPLRCMSPHDARRAGIQETVMLVDQVFPPHHNNKVPNSNRSAVEGDDVSKPAGEPETSGLGTPVDANTVLPSQLLPSHLPAPSFDGPRMTSYGDNFTNDMDHATTTVLTAPQHQSRNRPTTPQHDYHETSVPPSAPGPPFPCVYINLNDPESSHKDCRTLHKYVSSLRTHHERHKYFYCTTCFSVFETRELRESHGVDECEDFKCVTPGCPNEFTHQHGPCEHDIGKKNSQGNIWLELRRRKPASRHGKGKEQSFLPSSTTATPIKRSFSSASQYQREVVSRQLLSPSGFGGTSMTWSPSSASQQHVAPLISSSTTVTTPGSNDQLQFSPIGTPASSVSPSGDQMMQGGLDRLTRSLKARLVWPGLPLTPIDQRMYETYVDEERLSRRPIRDMDEPQKRDHQLQLLCREIYSRAIGQIRWTCVDRRDLYSWAICLVPDSNKDRDFMAVLQEQARLEQEAAGMPLGLWLPDGSAQPSTTSGAGIADALGAPLQPQTIDVSLLNNLEAFNNSVNWPQQTHAIPDPYAPVSSFTNGPEVMYPYLPAAGVQDRLDKPGPLLQDSGYETASTRTGGLQSKGQ